MAKMNYTELAAALTAGHPVNGAYDADDAVALGQFTAKNISATKESISKAELLDIIVANPTEYAAMSAAEREMLTTIFSTYDRISTKNNTQPRETLEIILGTATKAALVADLPITVSHYDQVKDKLGYSGELTESHITGARNQ